MKIRNALLAALSASAMLGLSAFANADVTIIGALSNFDCPNNTPEPCDEFEIEFEGPHSSDIYGFWGNFNYGMPTMVPNAAGTGVLITYKRLGRITNPGAIEHFGVHMTNFGLITNRIFRWKHNGVVVNSGAGSPPVVIPTVVVNPPITPVEPPELVETIENETPDQVIWVRRFKVRVPREVALGELMPNDPLILSATPIGLEMEKIEPGEQLVETERLESNDPEESFVYVVETYNDIATWNSITQSWNHVAGTTLLSRAMNAQVVQNNTCSDLPSITQQPQNIIGLVDGRASITVAATGPATGGVLNYSWRKEGIDMPGEDGPELTIDPLTLADSGQYQCVVSNACGEVISIAATLTVTECRADYDQSGTVQVSDIFDFLNDWFRARNGADFNRNGHVEIQDVFDFLNAWFTGC